jgi:hypothetical protein
MASFTQAPSKSWAPEAIQFSCDVNSICPPLQQEFPLELSQIFNFKVIGPGDTGPFFL